MWHEITYPFPNFNGCTLEVWEWISNFIPHIIMDVIIYPCSSQNVSSLLKSMPTCIRCQTFSKTNVDLFLIGPSGINLSEIWIKKIPAKWQPFCLGLDAFTHEFMRKCLGFIRCNVLILIKIAAIANIKRPEHKVVTILQIFSNTFSSMKIFLILIQTLF